MASDVSLWDMYSITFSRQTNGWTTDAGLAGCSKQTWCKKNRPTSKVKMDSRSWKQANSLHIKQAEEDLYVVPVWISFTPLRLSLTVWRRFFPYLFYLPWIYFSVVHCKAFFRIEGNDVNTEDQFALTLRWLMSYTYGAPILDVSRSHTTTQHSR